MNEANGESIAKEIASELLEAGASPFVPKSGAQLLDVAWALKDLCYLAWSSEPQRAARTAEVLQELTSRCGIRAEPSERAITISKAAEKTELCAVVDWTMGIAHLTRGEMAPALDRFDAAAEAFRQMGDVDHAAQTQVPKIMALSMLGKYSDATACAQRAREVFSGLGDDRSAGKVSLNLSALHERLGAYAEAVAESRSAAVLFARVGDRELSIMADINSGNALTSLGDFDEALRTFARAKMRADNRGFPVLEALADESIALVRLARGQYHSALAGLENARRRYALLGLPQHLATAEKQLGDAYLELRLLPEASSLFEKAIERFQGLDFPDEQAWTFVQLGRTHALLDRPSEALHSFERAAALFAQQGLGVGEATVNLARAELALATGEPALAMRLAARAAEDFDKANLEEGRLRADLVRAHASLRAGDVRFAGKLFARTLGRAHDLQLLTLRVRCLTGQGLAARALGELDDAKNAFHAAIELFEDQRSALPGDDLRTAFLSDHLRPYRAILGMALDEHEASPSAETAAEVLMQLDRVRARSLGERLSQGQTRGDGEPAQELRDRLNWLYRQVQRKEEEGESTPILVQEMRSVELELLEQARRARMAVRASGEYTAAVDDMQAAGRKDMGLDIGALRALMGTADALVEYGVRGNELFACVLTPAGVALLRNVATWRDVLDALRSARFQIDSLGHGTAPVHQHMETLTHRAQARLRQLYTLVWKPIADTLEEYQRILIVPHAELGLLPFAALHDGNVALVERFQLALVPSARLAMRGYQRQPAASRSLLALGESSRLPHAAQEAKFVGSLFDDSRVFTGAQASLSTVQNHAGQADILHLACHAQFRSDNPSFSALHFVDGPLTGELVETLSLRPGLVVLSACETGLSELGKGDEMVGLVRAFLVAGAARVLATGWSVDDQHTSQFMARFYRARCRGLAPAEALQRAQLESMREAPHPFHWAAFTLYGGF